MSSRIEVPQPRAIERTRVNYLSAATVVTAAKVTVPTPAAIKRSEVKYLSAAAKVFVPNPAVIDREKLKYLPAAAKVTVPNPAVIDREKLRYLPAAAKVTVPNPAVIDRARVSYLKQEEVVVPKAAVIDRAKVAYLSANKISVPKPALIDRTRLQYLAPRISVLQQNVHSPETPGSKNFPRFEITSELEEKADKRIAQYPNDQKRSAVLPLLHEVQHRFGFISPESIDWVAEKLEIAPIKVVEVVTFYPGFRQKAPGKFHVRVCRTLSCAMGGSGELMDKLCELTGIDRSKASHADPITVSPCGNYSVEFAECLASCGTAPVCLVNDDFHEGITAEKAEDFINSFQPL